MSDKFETLIKKAMELKNSEMKLSESQKAAIYAAGENIKGSRFKEILMRYNRQTIVFGACTACIVSFAVFMYFNGYFSPMRKEIEEIARIRSQLEETRALREEFAHIIKTQDIEFLRLIPNAEVNLNAALIVAEEKYVYDTDGFREVIKSKLKGGKL